jgi:hypothetical protein
VTERDDGGLRDSFALLRRDERSSAPAISALLVPGVRQPRPRPGPAAWVLAGLAAVTVAIAGRGVVAARLEHRAAAEVARALGPLRDTQWRAPTDALLETPGRESLAGVPALGRLRALFDPDSTPEPEDNP